jgi:DNA-binding HxlR family transcriptional regulator
MNGASTRDERFLQDWYSARALIAAEWAPAILVALLDGPWHYSEIVTILGESCPSEGWTLRHERLHESTLTRTLRQLTGDQLIGREEAVGMFPPSVRYSLTPAGRDLLQAAIPLALWARRHSDLVEYAQSRRQSGGGRPDFDDRSV